ncbi:hypothetical protein E2562_023978 [Oryza meyeriana var. granulata]|uniref:DUF834 domain-containing protein n=1 Tax=Oryza meyeriana var. granulata TaxID=110450 RepID=A0A6G1BYY5_9ORYZ|nr:hypothetical protein E2562_023978 [Oryza meyeriana var. granulata]
MWRADTSQVYGGGRDGDEAAVGRGGGSTGVGDGGCEDEQEEVDGKERLEADNKGGGGSGMGEEVEQVEVVSRHRRRGGKEARIIWISGAEEA